MFAPQDKAKPDTENIRGLNLAIKLTTVEVTKLPLWHKLNRIGIICIAKSGLTEELYILWKEYFSITCYMCDMYFWRRWSILIRETPILSSEGMLHKDYVCKVLVAKKKTGREPQEVWRQDELIGAKRPVVK
jgi:hypothetical protein